MVHKFICRFGILIVLSLVISSCSNRINGVPMIGETATAYPASPASIDQAYPVPKNDPEKLRETYFPNKLEVGTPRSGFGSAIGRLLINGSDLPYLGSLLLGEILYADSADAPPLIQFSEETSIRAIVDKSGSFLFTDLPPGEYGIIIWSPTGGTLLTDINSGEMIKVKVVADEITDLGKIYIK